MSNLNNYKLLSWVKLNCVTIFMGHSLEKEEEKKDIGTMEGYYRKIKDRTVITYLNTITFQILVVG